MRDNLCRVDEVWGRISISINLRASKNRSDARQLHRQVGLQHPQGSGDRAITPNKEAQTLDMGGVICPNHWSSFLHR